MLAIPGKACGDCSFCCKALEITQLAKPAGAWCEHCRAGGGCGVYATRPDICRDYECLWIGICSSESKMIARRDFNAGHSRKSLRRL
jgi:hypothetical protein